MTAPRPESPDRSDPLDRWIADLDRTDYPLPESLARPPARSTGAGRPALRHALAATLLLAAAIGLWVVGRGTGAPETAPESPTVSAAAPAPTTAPGARLERVAPIAFERRVATIHAGSHTIESVRRTHAAGLDAGE